MRKEYEVIKPFTILDLWNAFKEEHSCQEFQDKYGQLLQEVTFSGRSIKTKFDSFNSIKKYNALYDNLKYLEKKGFIKKIEEGIVLKPGMKLKDNFLKDRIVTVVTNNIGKIFLLDGFRLIIRAQNVEGSFKEGTTLKELNEWCSCSMNRFEVVDE